jgi:predicted nucleic acid-binding protein
MKVVADANVLVAALIRPDGWTAARLIAGDLRIVVPQQIVDELAEHAHEHAARAGVTFATWKRRCRSILRDAEIVSKARLHRHNRHPMVLKVAAADPDDAPFAAAFVASGADFLWTRDQALLDALPGIAVLVPPS